MSRQRRTKGSRAKRKASQPNLSSPPLATDSSDDLIDSSAVDVDVFDAGAGAAAAAAQPVDVVDVAAFVRQSLGQSVQVAFVFLFFFVQREIDDPY